MTIVSWQCVCPCCRHTFAAYLAGNYNPPHDAFMRDRRSLLCNVCERAFVNTLFRRVQQEVLANGGLALESLHLSALHAEAQRAGEPGPEAQAGTDQTRSVPVGVQGMPHRDRDQSMEDRVSKPMEQAHETLRGPTALPADPPE